MQTRYGFPTSTPEARGLSSKAILAFIKEIEREHINLQSLIIMRQGHVIADGFWAPFGPEKPHRMFSSRKALIGVAILFAIQEGFLHLEDRVIDLFPDKVPSHPGENLQKLTYYHMLTMTCGHAIDSSQAMIAPGADRPEVFFQQEFRYEPGTHFLYDNGIPDMLCHTIAHLTGKTILEYLQPRLFEPLGMKSFCTHTLDSLSAGTTICCSTPDLFRLTILYYQDGTWEGRQILNKELARMACSYLVPSLQDPEPAAVAYDTKFGFGFQIWRNSVGGFRIDGGQGQFGIGLPEMDLVACMNSNEGDQNIIPTLFWKHITSKLQAMPLTEDVQAFTALQQKVQSLTWAPVEDAVQVVPLAADYLFDRPLLGCERMRINYSDRKMTIITTIGTASVELLIGAPGEWNKGRSPFIFPEMVESTDLVNTTIPGYDPAEVYSSGHWVSGNKYELIFRSDAWIATHIITLEFRGGGLTAVHEDGITYSMRQRSPAFRPAIFETREKLILDTYLAVTVDLE